MQKKSENIKNKDTRESILATSLNLFGKLGFSKTTMNDIAEAAKRGRRTIYMYFQNKEEIFSAVIEKESKRIILELRNIIVSRDVGAEEKLESFFIERTRLILDLMKNRVALKNTYQENFNIIEKVRVILDKGEIDLLNNILTEGKEQNVFLVEKPLIIAHYIHIILKGLEFELIKSKTQHYEEQVIDMLNIILKGLLKNETKTS